MNGIFTSYLFAVDGRSGLRVMHIGRFMHPGQEEANTDLRTWKRQIPDLLSLQRPPSPLPLLHRPQDDLSEIKQCVKLSTDHRPAEELQALPTMKRAATSMHSLS
ncbi:hypothetical protein AAFF_G00057900 [Aldrovandia affinis]|uniref:Uncharacterized protein n=1 Tax=Aldrovandia affinis TaxID=143900 RepID=A0AAD7S0K1_9TELE|nr:hypothetical protein AAFF_G00057900 [Aldrovandia affinis]